MARGEVESSRHAAVTAARCMECRGVHRTPPARPGCRVAHARLRAPSTAGVPNHKKGQTPIIHHVDFTRVKWKNVGDPRPPEGHRRSRATLPAWCWRVSAPSALQHMFHLHAQKVPHQLAHIPHSALARCAAGSCRFNSSAPATRQRVLHTPMSPTAAAREQHVMHTLSIPLAAAREQHVTHTSSIPWLLQESSTSCTPCPSHSCCNGAARHAHLVHPPRLLQQSSTSCTPCPSYGCCNGAARHAHLIHRNRAARHARLIHPMAAARGQQAMHTSSIPWLLLESSTSRTPCPSCCFVPAVGPGGFGVWIFFFVWDRWLIGLRFVFGAWGRGLGAIVCADVRVHLAGNGRCYLENQCTVGGPVVYMGETKMGQTKKGARGGVCRESFGQASEAVGLYATFTRSSRCRGAVTSLVVCTGHSGR